MKTIFMLMAQYGRPAVEVGEIYEMLGYKTQATAYQAIRDLSFPVPTFRPHDSQKAKRHVMLQDLADHLDRCAEEAREQFKKMGA